jgi:hypothetical protein
LIEMGAVEPAPSEAVSVRRPWSWRRRAVL